MKLNSKILGSGKPLIIAHGLFGMLDNWQTIGKQLAEFYNVHLIDLRNHGRSFHSHDFNYKLMATDLRNYIKEEKLKDVIIIGHSMGGKAAMQLAVESPDLISNLIIVDIAPKSYPVHHDYIIKGLESLDFSIIKSRAEADNQLSYSINEIGVRQFLLKSLYWKKNNELALRFNLKSISKNIKKIGVPLEKGMLYLGDAIFIKGANSNYILDDDIDNILTHFPRATIKEIPNSGHWVHAEQPKIFLNVILNFLN